MIASDGLVADDAPVLLRKIGAVVLGLVGGWVVGFVVAQLLRNLLYPGFLGQLEYASNSGDHVLIGVVYIGVWAGASWYAIRFLLRRLRTRAAAPPPLAD